MRAIPILVFIAIFTLGSCAGPLIAAIAPGDSSSTTGPSGVSLSGTGKAKFDAYVMSQCPYGVQVENSFIPIAKKFGDSLDLNIDFIADEAGDGFRSLHGQKETDGDIIQLCAEKYSGAKYLDLILCMNENPSAIPGNWESCAKNLGIDSAKVDTCFKGEEGKSLLRESIKRTNAAGARASPTMFINGQPYEGGREPLDFQRAFCAAMDSKHEACTDIPACAQDSDCIAQPEMDGKCQNPSTKEAKCIYTEPAKVPVTLLTSEDCTSCDASGILGQLRTIWKGIDITEVDVSSSEGQKLASALKATVVPVLFFHASVADSQQWKTAPQLAGAFDNLNGGYVLKNSFVNAKFFIDDQARVAYYKDIGVSKGDNRPQIDFFVMSYCPYGNQAEEAIKPAFDKLKDRADFNPRWVFYSNYGGGGPTYCVDQDSKYCSMHGIQEANQDIREDCVKQTYDTGKFFDFALAMNSKCSAQNADTCWKGVADSLDIDTTKVQSCFDQNKVLIGKRDLELGNKLGVQGSPSVFIDGEEYGGPRTAEGYLSALCAAFDEKPAECDGVPEPAAVAAAPAAAGVPLGAGCGV